MNIEDFIICSAAKFEIEPILKLSQRKIRYLSFGIGSIKAAVMGQKFKNQLANSKLLIIGTCGSLSSFTKLELITVDKTFWLPTGQRIGQAWSLEQNIPSISLQPNPIFNDLVKKKVLTSPTISKNAIIDPKIEQEIGPKSELVENLELYTFLNEIKDSVKSVTCLLVVTNELCQNAREQWKSNHKLAANLTANYLIRKGML
ncbi:MAG: hypothetical protein CMP11_01840 [Zetaproteobacteria bacterium]|nr:hypothetical protein [Pseudobdellovibrionaceae bacterium]